MTQNDDYKIVWRLGIPPEEGKYPGRAHTGRRENGIIVERDVVVRTRDNVELLVDIFRPDAATDLPVILIYTPYGKHGRKNIDMFTPEGTAEGVVQTEMTAGQLSSYTVWEGPDPLALCRAGSAVVNADARGSWDCQGSLTFQSRTEAQDGHDVVEWAARLPWSNGNVGMMGVSYLAISQWNIASTRPPSLRAINPWEGYSDPYRDSRMHGGIRETRFRAWWIESTAYSRTRVEDIMAMSLRHPLWDAYWQDRTPDYGQIEVPTYAVVDWGDHGVHTRGTIEAYKRASSKQKWLEVHARMKWRYFYRPPSVERQISFFNTSLRPDRGFQFTRPKVNIEVRKAHFVGEVHDETVWPLPQTMYRKLYLDASSGALIEQAPSRRSTVSFEADNDQSEVTFTHTFERDTEITGYMALHIWISAPDGEDADIFVAVDKLDRSGERVGFLFQSKFHDGPVALGWLRASHRELDEELSTEWQTWHTHQREQLLLDDQPVLIDVEIWPSSRLFRVGESLQLRIKGQEVFTYPDTVPVFVDHKQTRNVGRHIIHAGAEHPSHLLIPVIPVTSSVPRERKR